MTDKHKEFADFVYNTLKNTTSVETQTFRKLGGEIYEVLNWFVAKNIIKEDTYGYSKGVNFYKYTTLEELLLGDDEKEPDEQLPIQVHQTITNSTFNQSVGHNSNSHQEVRHKKSKSSWVKICLSIITGMTIITVAYLNNRNSTSTKPESERNSEVTKPVDTVHIDTAKTITDTKPAVTNTIQKKSTKKETVKDGNETYHVESHNQTGGITAGKVEIHNDAIESFLGVNGNYQVEIDKSINLILVWPKNGVWDKSFVGVLITEPNYEELEFGMRGMSMNIQIGPYDITINNQLYQVYGAVTGSPAASVDSPLTIKYKTTPPATIVFGASQREVAFHTF